MQFRHITEHCFDDRLGAQGVERSQITSLLAQMAPFMAQLKQRKNPQFSVLLDLPAKTDDLGELEKIAADIRARFSHLVVAGAGGSGLSGRVLTLLKPAPTPLSLHFLDNIDPDAMDDCLNSIDLKKTCFLIVSKSGATVETLGQFLVLFERAQQITGAKASDHFIVITTQGSNPMRDIASERGIRILTHSNDIGGRFSALTNVGLLPAAIAGLDIAAFRCGAQSIVADMDAASDPSQCPAALGAALQYAFIGKGRNISVMLPYCERLAGFSSWYRQCWAESLGKGGKGSTPIRAVGTADQHSQLQLYLDGPKDKLFHLVTLKRATTGQAVPVPARSDLDYLRGATTGDIMAAEQKATFETLVKNGCPVRLFELDRLSEIELGALLMHFTLEIMFMSHLLGVDPFDQPAVEEGKLLTQQYLHTKNL